MQTHTVGLSHPILVLSAAMLLLLQQLPSPLQAQTASPKALNIVIVQGDGAVNNVRERVAREPIVEVQDENHKPVAGAVVVFLLPNSGPSGTFLDGSRMLTVTTGQGGRAAATGLQPNAINGPMQIRVSANFQGLSTNVTITQTNAIGSAAATSAGTAAGAGGGGGLSGGVIAAIVAVAAAGAVGAAVALTRGNSSSPAPTTPPTTITLGTGTVGHP